MDQASVKKRIDGNRDKVAAVGGVGIGFFAQDGSGQVIGILPAAGSSQPVEYEAGNRRKQEGLTGGWVVADPSFIDFLPSDFSKPVEYGVAGDVARTGRQQNAMEAWVS